MNDCIERESVLISIQPEWCDLIKSGMKTVEVRKSRPNLDTPFKVYIYCTIHGCSFLVGGKHPLSGNGMIVGEFVCDCIISHCEMQNADISEQQGCIKREKLLQYSNGKELYGWHISNLVIYDKQKNLSEFQITRPPQSWCYVEERKPEMLSAGNRIDEDIANGGLAPATSDGAENFEIMPG